MLDRLDASILAMMTFDRGGAIVGRCTRTFIPISAGFACVCDDDPSGAAKGKSNSSVKLHRSLVADNAMKLENIRIPKVHLPLYARSLYTAFASVRSTLPVPGTTLEHNLA